MRGRRLLRGCALVIALVAMGTPADAEVPASALPVSASLTQPVYPIHKKRDLTVFFAIGVAINIVVVSLLVRWGIGQLRAKK